MPDPAKKAPASPVVPEPDTAVRRRRHLIQSAAVVRELTATLIADSRDLIARSNDLIAEPYMVVTSASGAAPAARQTFVCERCGRGIETPGVAIVSGRNLTHVRCERGHR